MGKYQVDEKTLEVICGEKRALIEAGQPVEMNVMDRDTMSWVKARVLLSSSPVEGGEKVLVLDHWGKAIESAQWHWKVEEEISEEELEEAVYRRGNYVPEMSTFTRMEGYEPHINRGPRERKEAK